MQGGMADRRPTINIYNYLINLFRTHQELFITPPLTDAEYEQQYGIIEDIDYDDEVDFVEDEFAKEYEDPEE
jgi:hypothetical protein